MIAQPPIFALNEIVNVAKVAKYSPFRYPGGKTWLVPRIRKWLSQNRPDEFVEVFAGGGIVGLTVTAERLARHVTMVELDEQVAAVWKTILTDNEGAWLADRILNFDLTPETLRRELARPAQSTRERAFQTILKNRTYRGGILAEGSRPVNRGENGRGINSRWYAETLRKRVLYIATIRERITFIEGDGVDIIRDNADRQDFAFFIDPPYSHSGKKAASRLYTHFELNHEELFRLMSRVAGDFLMTYENTDEVRELAGLHGFDTEPVAMKNTHHAEMTELLIGRDLSWAR